MRALAISRDPLAAVDSVRRRLIRLRLDLHDGPMQELVAAGFALGLLDRELEALPVDTSSVSRQLDAVRRQMGEVERSLRSLLADDIDGEASDIVDLVQDEVTRFERWNGARVELDVSGNPEPATHSQRIALQRVLREALTNVARHADATEVRVELFETDDVIYLRVRDNGQGCNENSAGVGEDGRSHLGLQGMRERLELLGGSLSFTTRPGGPTTLTAAVKRWRPAGEAAEQAGSQTAITHAAHSGKQRLPRAVRR